MGGCPPKVYDTYDDGGAKRCINARADRRVHKMHERSMFVPQGLLVNYSRYMYLNANAVFTFTTVRMGPEFNFNRNHYFIVFHFTSLYFVLLHRNSLYFIGTSPYFILLHLTSSYFKIAIEVR